LLCAVLSCSSRGRCCGRRRCRRIRRRGRIGHRSRVPRRHGVLHHSCFPRAPPRGNNRGKPSCDDAERTSPTGHQLEASVARRK
jgi:hypothetical protein